MVTSNGARHQKAILDATTMAPADALRREGEKAWRVEVDDGYHIINNAV